MNIPRAANDRDIPLSHPRITELLKRFRLSETPLNYYIDWNFFRFQSSRSDFCYYSLPMQDVEIINRHVQKVISLDQYRQLWETKYDAKKVSDIYFSPTYWTLYYKYDGKETSEILTLDIDFLKSFSKLVSRDESEQDTLAMNSAKAITRRDAMGLI